ncbi:MAG: putative 2-dehydropantoate 2-reductase [Acaryochloridaceae cyanobacterium RL_2_7]|nr:putative 2-dehydropantoate 2-reductase [Acaryochloridaceae cyanobacterium RL_2_7]
MTDKRYAVIGTGAVGGFYGAKLKRAGLDVHYLLRSDYPWVKTHGLKVLSPQGDFSLPNVSAYASTQDMPLCDVVVVALKTTQNNRLPELLRPILKPDSTLVILQNGLGNEAAIAHSLATVIDVSHLTIVGGLCFLCSNKLEPGVIQHLDYGVIKMGLHQTTAHSEATSQRFTDLVQAFRAAEIEIETYANLPLERWKKLLWNIPFNGLSVVLDARTNELMECPGTLSLVKDLMREVTELAAKTGCRIDPSFPNHLLELTQQMFPYHTSMKLDADAGREMEVEAMFGNPIRAARQHQLECPQMEMLYHQLQFLNGRIKQGHAT